jgi:hypothetical protein
MSRYLEFKGVLSLEQRVVAKGLDFVLPKEEKEEEDAIVFPRFLATKIADCEKIEGKIVGDIMTIILICLEFLEPQDQIETT